jgi:hypothetical protein
LTHDDLEKTVGDSISIFAVELLKLNKPENIQDNNFQYGVFFPEEIKNKFFSKSILSEICKDALHFEIF